MHKLNMLRESINYTPSFMNISSRILKTKGYKNFNENEESW